MSVGGGRLEQPFDGPARGGQAAYPSVPSAADYRSLAARLTEETRRAEEAEKKAAMDASLAVPLAAAHVKAEGSGAVQETTAEAQGGEEAVGSGTGNIGTRSGGRRQTQQRATAAAKEKEHPEEWVQCDSCSRWRLLPAPSHPQYPGQLPDTWNCSMNTWSPSQASCRLADHVWSCILARAHCVCMCVSNIWQRPGRHIELLPTERTEGSQAEASEGQLFTSRTYHSFSVCLL